MVMSLLLFALVYILILNLIGSLICSGVQASDGIYGVEGNHDNWGELFAAMEKYGIIPLDNQPPIVFEEILCQISLR